MRRALTSSRAFSPRTSDVDITNLGECRWKVRIIGAITLFDPKPYVAYQLRVEDRKRTWNVMKRYTLFIELHKKLKEKKYHFDARLPERKLWGNLNKEFIQNRRVLLQKYVDCLLWNRQIMQSEELVEFLKPAKETDRRAVKEFKRGNTTMSTSMPASGRRHDEQVALAREAAKAHKSRSPKEKNEGHDAILPETSPGACDGSTTKSPSRTAKASAESTSTSTSTSPAKAKSTSTATATASTADRRDRREKDATARRDRRKDINNRTPSKSSDTKRSKRGGGGERSPPLKPRSRGKRSQSKNERVMYDLFEEVFELESRAWVRKQAIGAAKTISKLTLLNGAIGAWLGAYVDHATSEKEVVGWINLIKEQIWPGGVLAEASTPPTDQDIATARQEAKQLFQTSIPGSLQALIGKKTCTHGCDKLFTLCQLDLLLQHFAYTVLDAFIIELFPELKKLNFHAQK